MPEINGEAISPRAGVGAAYILGRTAPDALNILIAGERGRQATKARAAAAQAKADADRAKELGDRLKYNIDGSHIFGSALQEQVYAPLNDELIADGKANPTDAYARAAASRPRLSRAESETQMSGKKTTFYDEAQRKFKSDPKLYDSKYALESQTKSLRDEQTGRAYLPSQVDEEAWLANLQGDEKLYNEGEVIERTSKKLLDNVTSRISQAGTLGGQHQMDQTRGQLMAFDAGGRPIKNADGSHKVALTQAVDTMLDSDPVFKLKTDKRVADYDAARAADPSLPAMSRRGHHAQMIGPLLHYDVTHDEGLNAQVRQPRAAGRGSSFELNPETSYEGGVIGADVQTGEVQSDTPVFIGGTAPALTPYRTNQEQTAVLQQGIFSPVRRAQPTYKTKSDPAKTFMFKGLPVTEIIKPGKNGSLTIDKNNKNGIFGVPQQGMTIFRNRQTGAVELPPNNEAAYNERLAKLGPGWKMEAVVQMAVPVNKDYANEVGPVRDRLKAKEAEKVAQGNGYVSKTDDELESAAFKLASGGTETQYIPYDRNNSNNIDGQTSGAFREFGTKVVPGKEREIRSRAPQQQGSKSGGGPLASPSTPTIKAPPAQPNNKFGFKFKKQ